MSNEMTKINQTNPETETVVVAKEFKGYTMEELRYQRALVALQKEFCKSKVIHNLDKVRHHKLFGKDGNASHFSKVGSLAAKIFSGLNYLDYIMLGMSVFGSGRKIFKFFRKAKK